MTELNRSHNEILDRTVDIVSAFASHNTLQPEDLTKLITDVFAAMREASSGKTAQVQAVAKASAYEIRRSITREALISFEDGKPYKTLRRHLARLGLTPETYRQKWGLPHDYPMTSADYSKRRSDLARALTLGLPLGEAGAAKLERRPAPGGRQRPASERAGAARGITEVSWSGDAGVSCTGP